MNKGCGKKDKAFKITDNICGKGGLLCRECKEEARCETSGEKDEK